PPRRARYQRSPFIFDQAAARRLLATARALADGGSTLNRGSTYHLIFAILYGLGLRFGEACRLCVKDVDLDRRVLVIRQTKFYKSRLVPSARSWRSFCVNSSPVVGRGSMAAPTRRPRCSDCSADGQ